jgi:eukaryotic-like serine/threonine-protein kinase
MGQTAEQALTECRKFFNDCTISWFADEQPPHNVSLEAYWIDRTEVTNLAYSQCVNAGACLPPASDSSESFSSYYGNQQYADYPVLQVDWERAKNYCAWAGGRLPTEAEWENAARGTDGRTYPWGNTSPTCARVNFGEPKLCTGDTSKVGSYPEGASAYGLLDMAGNVSEWVYDWYSDATYSQPVQGNPTGPITGEEKVVRGGAWNLNPNFLRTTNRDHQVPAARNDYIGFRCALEAK